VNSRACLIFSGWFVIFGLAQPRPAEAVAPFVPGDPSETNWWLGNTGDTARLKNAGHFQERIDALIRLAESYEALGKSRLARESLEKAAGLLRESDDAGLEARIDGSLGRLFWLNGDLEAAALHLDQSIQQARSVGDHATLSLSRRNRGNLA